MKITIHKGRKNEGNILFLALILCIIIGTTLGSYLALTAGQEQSVARSKQWNFALDVAEAGIEEGLAQVNETPHDFSLNTWGVYSVSNFGPQIRNISGGTYGVLIQGTNVPTIFATGMVTAPITGKKIRRTVRVTTQVVPLFDVGLGAVGDIQMNGNSLATLSWNSMSPTLSSNGVYNANMTSTNGDVASQGGIVNIGQHTIDGNMYLGPNATYTSGTNQVYGTIYNDYNVNFPDVQMPAAVATAVPAIYTNGEYYITSSGNYSIPAVHPVEVAPGLNVTLNVTANNFSLNGIIIDGGMTNSATVTMYANPPPGGALQSSGNSTIGAVNSRPENFILYGMPSLASITFGGSTTFIGAIYAPDAAMTLNGGGSGFNLEGAAIVGTATVNGHFNVEYDESLAQFGPAKGFAVNSWQEL